MKQNSPQALPAFHEEKDCVYAVIETPQGSRNKFKWDEKRELYMLSNVLPAGQYYPFDFGFIPSTLADDGDPIDILVLLDAPAFPGCVLEARLIGLMEAEEDNVRNDRLIAVADKSRDHADINSLKDLSKEMMHELEQFFITYHGTEKQDFKVLGQAGPKRALELVKEAVKNAKKRRGG